jgi:hypothetical protein
VGVGAAVVGVLIGLALSDTDVIDCSAMPEECMK